MPTLTWVKGSRASPGDSTAIALVNDTDFLITNEPGKMFLVERKGK